jgi:hypothetical protein
MNDFDDFAPIAVEGSGPAAAEGFAVIAELSEPDPDWQPL